MEEENNRYKHYHDLLDSLANIVRKTEKPLSDLTYVGNVVYYGYNHRHVVGGHTHIFPLNKTEMSFILHADILATLDYLRELHPFASTQFLVALCSFCLQYNFSKAEYEATELYKSIKDNCSLIEIAHQLTLYCSRRGERCKVCEKRRAWELSLLFQRDVELDNHLSFDLDF